MKTCKKIGLLLLMLILVVHVHAQFQNHPFQNKYQKEIAGIPQYHFSDFGLQALPKKVQIDKYFSGDDNAYHPDGLRTSDIYEFDEQGFVARRINLVPSNFENDGTATIDTFYYNYYYNESKQLFKIDLRYKMFEIEFYVAVEESYGYNESGDLIWRMKNYKDGDTISITNFVYENHNVVAATYLGKTKFIQYTNGYLTHVNKRNIDYSYNYNSDGTLRKLNGNAGFQFVYLLDEKGSIVFEEAFDSYEKYFKYYKVVYADGTVTGNLNPIAFLLMEARNAKQLSDQNSSSLDLSNVQPIEKTKIFNFNNATSTTEEEEVPTTSVADNKNFSWMRNGQVGYYIFENGKQVYNVKSFWKGQDLVVVDTVNLRTFIINDYFQNPFDTIMPIELFQEGVSSFWYKSTDSTYLVFENGIYNENLVFKSYLNNKDAVLVSKNKPSSGYVLEDYTTTSINELKATTPYFAIHHLAPETKRIFWWKQNNELFLKVNDTLIQQQVVQIEMGEDLIVFDANANNYYLLPSYKNCDTLLIHQGWLVAESTSAIWYKNTSGYRMYIDGISYSHKNKWAENGVDIITIDELSNEENYRIKDYQKTPLFEIRKAEQIE